ncbi:hypothetical protein [Rhodococcoides yunnanense]|uniref:Uncharacterized protein n=1 Tax=Rhodococcoides yunnanense TaxID=278209 RepID=A0ABU4BIT9_9NOCA|nr:hypothetical protein [Rhodococcus yunnanensis]MDV6263996.1 hypothetical protein [Rhodococcus yunnanensis]
MPYAVASFLHASIASIGSFTLCTDTRTDAAISPTTSPIPVVLLRYLDRSLDNYSCYFTARDCSRISLERVGVRALIESAAEMVAELAGCGVRDAQDLLDSNAQV